MEYHFTIATALPDLNTYIDAERTSRYKAASMKKSATRTCAVSCRELRKKVDQSKRYDVVIYWHLPNRMKDPDNIAFAKKFIHDGLVEGKVLKGDGANNIGDLSDKFIYDGKQFTVVTLIEN